MLFRQFITGLQELLAAGIDNRENAGLPPDMLNLSATISPFSNLFKKYSKSKIEALAKATVNCFNVCEEAPFMKNKQLDPAFFAQTEPSVPTGKILCGPLLRKATPESVSVWIALEKADNPKLSVFQNNNGSAGEKLMEGTAATIRFGNKLNIVLITAKPLAGKKVEFGQTLLYNIEFSNHKNLDKFTDNTFTFKDKNFTLPSFVIPPLDLNQLYILHGSCRNMSSDALDNLAAIESLMSKEWEKRPQQLFLSGDQIYADEANEFLEHVYIETGNTLMQGLSQSEKMPSKEGQPADIDPAKIIPGERGLTTATKDFHIGTKRYNFPELVTAFGGTTIESRDFIHDLCGFTPTSRFHLFSLSDFFAVYLMSWSDEVWPVYTKGTTIAEWARKLVILKKQDDNGDLPSGLKSPLADLQNSKKELSSIIGIYESELKKVRTPNENPDFAEIIKLCHALKKFLTILSTLKDFVDAVHFVSGLSKVRRALANISTYMIFDDHEVTDDWHMTREWVHRAYTMPMGRRVMQNALASFAVFQAWGNTPEKFVPGDTASSGTKLLKAISDWISGNFKNAAQEKIIANLLKIPFGDQVARYRKIGPGESFPEIFDKPLEWHFTFRHPKYEVLVLDARTFRSFPGSLYGPADHISTKSLEAQTGSPEKLAAPFDKEPPEVTIVISPCNVLTIPLFRNYLSAVALPLAHYITSYDGSRWQMAAYDPDQADSWEVATKMYEAMLARLATRRFKNFSESKKDSFVVILSGDVHFSFAGRIAYYAEKPLGSTESKAHTLVAAHLTSSGFRNEPGAWRDLKLDLLGYEFTDFGNANLRLPEPEIMAGYGKKPTAFNKAKTDEVVLGTRWFPNYKPRMILEEPLLLPAHKINANIALPKPEWLYRLDFMRAINNTPAPNISQKTHFGLVTDQKPSTEILRRSSFAAISLDWEGDAKLVADISNSAGSFQIDTTGGKKFPPAPFYITIDKEIMYVNQSTDDTGGKFTLKVARGKGDSEKAIHKKNTAAKIRKAVSQTNWVSAEPSAKDPVQNQIKDIPLNQFKVPLAADDLQFPKPEVRTV